MTADELREAQDGYRHAQSLILARNDAVERALIEGWKLPDIAEAMGLPLADVEVIERNLRVAYGPPLR